MELIGVVTSGLGTAKTFVKMIEKTFKEKTNLNVFPGTLNVKLKKDFLVKPDFIIRPEEFGGNQNVLVQKCLVLNQSSYIVRAEKNQNSNRGLWPRYNRNCIFHKF